MFDAVLRWWFAPVGNNATIKRVLAFGNDDSSVIEYLRLDPDNLDDWERVATRALQARGAVVNRVEIRMTDKRRVLLYPGDAWNDKKTPVPRIVMAMLLARLDADPPARSVNVTSRVKKYAGTTCRSVHHMFPFDDPDDTRARFREMRVIHLNGTVDTFAIK